jgi:5-methylcytosine-specific restriction endonuclease McrA
VSESEKKVISRGEARALGLRVFFTSVACKRGHVAERYVTNGGCVECERERAAKWREANPDKERERAAKWREANPDKERERRKEYRAKNAEKLREYQARYRAENPDKVRQIAADFYVRNKEKVQQRHAEYNEKNADKVKEMRDKYKKENAEKIHQKGREYYWRTLEKQRERSARYREENAEKLRQRQQRRYWDNVEKESARKAEFYRKNPEVFVARTNARRAKQKDAGGSHTKDEIISMLKSQGYKCAVCKVPISFQPSGDERKINIDHIVPISRKGSSDISNLQGLCQRCNNKKRDKTMEEWIGNDYKERIERSDFHYLKCQAVTSDDQ